MKIAIPEPGEPQPNYRNALYLLGAEPVQVTGAVNPSEFGGLLLPGGADLNPARYGCEHRGSKDIDDALDELQLAVLERFLQAEKPVLGICRGHQLLTVRFGGRLIQHLPTADHHTVTEGEERDRFHTVKAMEGTLLQTIYGSAFTVNSTHHQAAEAAPEGLRVTALSDDGVIEGLCHETLPILSVQWHPERMCGELRQPDKSDGTLLLREFLRLCEK